MKAAVDNDILFKCACYGLLQDLPATLKIDATDCGVLGAARFVVTHKLERTARIRARNLAVTNLNSFLSTATTIEPIKAEQALAAHLEACALRVGLTLDAGESQLCAVAIERMASRLVTGDKRAICALERLIDEEPKIIGLSGKLMCLEQILLLILAERSFEPVRKAVCAEPEADKALSICFSCTSACSNEQTAHDGLSSYIRALRSEANRLLAN